MTDPVRRLTPAAAPSSEPRARAFAEAMSAARGKHVLIALRGHPDPDGIACAITQAHIAQRLGVAQTTVGYCHELSHRENRALVKLLGLELRKIKSVQEVGKVDFLALVDAHELDPELADTQGLEVLTHRRPPPRHLAAEGALRRPAASTSGATATIFVEYLQELAALDADVEEDRRIATALMHGLATDTDDFMLARAADFRAASADRRGAAIATCSRTYRGASSRRRRWTSSRGRSRRSSFAATSPMAGVGFVSEAERDTIAQAADFLVRREDIDTCVVYGVVGDKYIEGSLRTHSPSVDPAVWLEQAFGARREGSTLRRRAARQGRLPHPHRLPRDA